MKSNFTPTVTLTILSCVRFILSMALLEAHHTLELLLCTCLDEKHTYPKEVLTKHGLVAIGVGDKLTGVAVSKMILESALVGVDKNLHYILRYSLEPNPVTKPLRKDVPVLILKTDDTPDKPINGKLTVYFGYKGGIRQQIKGVPYRGSVIHRSTSTNGKAAEENKSIVLLTLDEMKRKEIDYDTKDEISSSNKKVTYPILFTPDYVPPTEEGIREGERPPQNQATYDVFWLSEHSVH